MSDLQAASLPPERDDVPILSGIWATNKFAANHSARKSPCLWSLDRGKGLSLSLDEEHMEDCATQEHGVCGEHPQGASNGSEFMGQQRDADGHNYRTQKSHHDGGPQVSARSLQRRPYRKRNPDNGS